MDLAVFAAHPDDAELFAGGLIARCVDLGYDVGICHLTRGEMATRGTPEERHTEAQAAARALGLSMGRVEALDLGDTRLDNNEENRLQIIRVLRKWRPRVVAYHHSYDRHPDHRKASQLVNDAFFYSHLRSLNTGQEPFRTQGRFQFFNNTLPDRAPSFIVDVSDVFERKVEAIKAYRSQFHNPEYQGAQSGEETFISSPEFFEMIEVKARFWGGMIGVRYGEPYVAPDPIGVADPIQTILPCRAHR